MFFSTGRDWWPLPPPLERRKKPRVREGKHILHEEGPETRLEREMRRYGQTYSTSIDLKNISQRLG